MGAKKLSILASVIHYFPRFSCKNGGFWRLPLCKTLKMIPMEIVFSGEKKAAPGVPEPSCRSGVQGVHQVLDVNAHGMLGTHLVPLEQELQNEPVVAEGNVLHLPAVLRDLHDLVHRAVDNRV